MVIFRKIKQKQEEIADISDSDVKISYIRPQVKKRSRKRKTCQKKNPFIYSNIEPDCKKGEVDREVHLGLSGPIKPFQSASCEIPEFNSNDISTLTNSNSVKEISSPYKSPSEFSLSNTSFMQGYNQVRFTDRPPRLYEDCPKTKVQINRPKRIRKRKKKLDAKIDIMSKSNKSDENPKVLPIISSTESAWCNLKAKMKKEDGSWSKDDLPSVLESPIYSILKLITNSEVELCQKVYEIIQDKGKLQLL